MDNHPTNPEDALDALRNIVDPPKPPPSPAELRQRGTERARARYGTQRSRWEGTIEGRRPAPRWKP